MRAILILLTAFLTDIAVAAPAEYRDKFPAEIMNMTPRQSEIVENRATVFYAGPVGRATVTIVPATSPDADGITPSAQKALSELMARNFENGTKALGDGYTTEPMNVSQLKADGINIICGSVVRKQKPGDKQLNLMDRDCVTQHKSDLLRVYVTTPYKASNAGKVRNDQLGFIALTIKHLSQ